MADMTLVVQKISINRLGKASEQAREISNCLRKRAKVAGVQSKLAMTDHPIRFIADDGKEKWKYEAKITLTKTGGKNPAVDVKYLELAQRYIRKAAEGRAWTVLGDIADIEEREAALENRPRLVIPSLTTKDIQNEFPNVYMRESHINIIHLAAKAAVTTEFQKRSHVILFGQPAAAKTILFLGLKNFYERFNEGERIASLDATSVTKAGLENWIIDKARSGLLPEFLILEEIEKYNPDNLLCMLSIMDGRGTLQKTNARIGSVIAKTPIVIWATCNDDTVLRSFHRGALWSRFTHQLECVRPDENTMIKIMLDKIRSWRKLGLDMDDRCAEVAVKYAFKELGTDDPRAIEGILDAGNLLLNDTYFAYHRDIRNQVKMKKSLLTKDAS